MAGGRVTQHTQPLTVQVASCGECDSIAIHDVHDDSYLTYSDCRARDNRLENTSNATRGPFFLSLFLFDSVYSRHSKKT